MMYAQSTRTASAPVARRMDIRNLLCDPTRRSLERVWSQNFDGSHSRSTWLPDAVMPERHTALSTDQTLPQEQQHQIARDCSRPDCEPGTETPARPDRELPNSRPRTRLDRCRDHSIWYPRSGTCRRSALIVSPCRSSTRPTRLPARCSARGCRLSRCRRSRPHHDAVVRIWDHANVALRKHDRPVHRPDHASPCTVFHHRSPRSRCRRSPPPAESGTSCPARSDIVLDRRVVPFINHTHTSPAAPCHTSPLQVGVQVSDSFTR